MNKTIHTLFPILVTVLLMLSPFSNVFAQRDTASASDDYEVPEPPDESLFNQNTDVMQKQSNKLWIEYNRWVHKVMACLNDDDPSEYSIRRLLKHEGRVDELVDYWYSDNMGKKLSELLHARKALLAEMRMSLKGVDSDRQAEAYQRMIDNKNEVIEFIRHISP